ncbi:alanine--tRNA ligase-related protein [Deinococcus sp. Leaf326]|uniref:alanyl-tRNA editing protein n=1 Tax=Deinococcus sp. Leaf326 TaxID=1736338 RepID=UPI0006FFCF28|nr:alanine--tRNA ligase-related protein [Deinococcus sp. Leaf326]KQR35994.1 serine-tRNA(Ala) deacylase [Deinococcus sp. Leaf326]
MTVALYHRPGQDGQALTFTAEVRAVGESGGTPEVMLDRTAFYPEGGGQSGDAGRLVWAGGEAAVEDTRKDKASSEVWHRLAPGAALPLPGTTVGGEVDAARRARHMQRHSGEHLLAQAFARVNPAFEVAAVSMTGPECHLDLRGDPTEADVRAAEALLRVTLGRDDLTLETPVVDEADLDRYPLRRETKVRGQVRLVIFRDAAGDFFDVSACGGTHVPRAAQVAPVAVLRTERIKSGLTRVTFMAGEEAAEYLSGVYRGTRALAQSLSVPVDRVGERVGALGAELLTLRAEAESLRAALAGALVAAQPAETLGTLSVRALTLPDAALLAPALAAVPAGEVLLVLAPGGRCGVASATPAVRAGEVLRAALAVTGGRGGGRAELAQGSTEAPEAFFGAVRDALA